MNAGIVARRTAPGLLSGAARVGLPLALDAEGWSLRWDRTLFVAPETAVPWDLVPFGFTLLERWDVAAPFTREKVLARDLGDEGQTDRTRALLRDLRVPVYSPDLLFVRDSEAGAAFLACWRVEAQAGDDRLAFLRALALVKPLFCGLPRVWLAGAAEREKLEAVAGTAIGTMGGSK